jgi:hypothetical protein
MQFVGKEILVTFSSHKTDFRKPSFTTTGVQPTPTYIFQYMKTRGAYIDTACYCHRKTKIKFAQ